MKKSDDNLSPLAKRGLVPDADALIRFSEIVFSNANPRGVVSARAFPQERGTPLFSEGIHLGSPQYRDVIVERARQAAQWELPAVFCPPVCTFSSPRNAKANNLFEGVTLSVDLDHAPRASYRELAELIGNPTVTVASGGEWIDPETGEVQPKGHLHWRLRTPTASLAEHNLLHEARKLAATVAKSDPSAASIVHPLRWPGSWHTKSAPRLSHIAYVTNNEIDLREALAILRAAVPKPPRISPQYAPPAEGARGYYSSAFDQEIGALTRAVKPGRNHQLNRSGFSLFQLVAIGKLKDYAVESALLHACSLNGLIRDKGEASVMATIRSARAGGFAKPRRVA